MEQEQKSTISRRNFLKIAGVAGVALQAGGLIAAGVEAGADTKSYTGWESFNPGTQFFDRTPFEFEGPAHVAVAAVRRPGKSTDYVFNRVAIFQTAYQKNPTWTLDKPLTELELPPEVIEFYKEFPERLEWDFKTFAETIPQQAEDNKIYGAAYTLAFAYSAGFSAISPFLPQPKSPPEVSDFQQVAPVPEGQEPRKIREPIPFKSPELAAEFIKEMAHRYGATLVRITKTNLDYLYSDGWRGCPKDYDFSKLPAHWEYAICIGVPMEWDVIANGPMYSTSSDGYDRVSMAAFRLEACLKNLGYPARTHSPYGGYDLVVPPHTIEAGMGEVGRMGFCVTPELGPNIRTAIVTTSLPMAVDKPIHFGVDEFCKKCKICAEMCPSGAISTADNDDQLVLRGYKHWYINNGACYNYWREKVGPLGCRLCVSVCPYSRKNNWVHNVARTLDPRDPTGVVSSGLLWAQKTFFGGPEAKDFRRPPEGYFAEYRPAPFYLQAERYLAIDVVKATKKG